MEDTIISFETAKLAKEKGFNIPVRYGVFGIKMKLTENHGWTYNRKLELRNWNTSNANSYSIPTQALLQKWLREVHKIIIIPLPIDSYDSWYYKIFLPDVISPFFEIPIYLDNEFKTYEEALEVGLQEALKLITNK
jgi:hypothetical protein